MVANSAPFATPLAGVTSTLKLDVYVPPGQPNPYWFGAVQLFASCPSAAMNNAYLGQVELTGKPTGAFSALSYTVPSTVQTTLLGAHNDCFFSVARQREPDPDARRPRQPAVHAVARARRCVNCPNPLDPGDR